MILHPINQHLPRITHEILQQNDQENHRDISNIFELIMNSPEMIVNSKLLGKVLRLIESRFTMKYIMTVKTLSLFLITQFLFS